MADTSLLAFLSNRCPQCGEGPIVEGLLRMKDKCSSCGLVYEREPGQNWGAMVLSYAFGAVLAFPIFFALLIHKATLPVALGVPTLVLAAVAPFSVRVSRLAWTHVMYALRPPTTRS